MTLRLVANIVHYGIFLSNWTWFLASVLRFSGRAGRFERQAPMGKVMRNLVLSLAISTSVAAPAAEPAAAKHAPHHYASTCQRKDAHPGRGAWCRRQRHPGANEAEADALLQCLFSQPFAACD